MKKGVLPLDRDASYASVTVGTSLTTIFQVGRDACSRLRHLYTYFKNAGDTALNAFAVEIKLHNAADWVTLYDEAADYDSPQGFLDWVLGSPEDLASSAYALLALADCNFSDLRIRASVASGSTTVNGYGSMIEW